MKFEVVVYCLIDECVSFDIALLAIKFHEGENVSIDFRRNCFLIYLFSHDSIILKINYPCVLMYLISNVMITQ